MRPTKPRPRAPAPSAALSAALLVALAGPGTARAETSPYYLGISETVFHDSNLYRLAPDQAQPVTVDSRSDTVLTTALVGGVDQTWGRQRLSGSASLRDNRYQSNSQLNYTGYGLNAALDWATVERVSGTLAVSGDRSLRRYDSVDAKGAVSSVQNIETDRSVDARFRVGVVTRLTLNAGWRWDSTDLSAEAYSGYRNRRHTASLGASWRAGGATTLAAGWRQGRVSFPSGGSGYDRDDLDLSVTWAPSALTSIYGRVSRSKLAYDTQSASQNDRSDTNWELRASTQVSGKVQLRAALWRDYGLSFTTYTQQIEGTPLATGGITNFSLRSTTWRLAADWAATGKLTVNTGWTQVQRDLSSTLVNPLFGAVGAGSDSTGTFTLGARWAYSRAASFGCDLSRERRTVDSNISRPYSSTGFGCFGQIVMQ